MKKILINTIIFAFLILFFGNIVNGWYQVPVLMYHGIDNDPRNSRLLVSENTFEKQMNFLKNKHFKFLTLDEYAEMLKANRKPARNSVVITFDDGFEDNYTMAYPVLKKYKIPATIFVIVGDIGKKGMMSWQQLEDLNNSRLVSIESHSLTHCDLTKTENGELLKEVSESKKILEEKLKKTVNYFCYPFGFFTGRVKDEVKKAGYKGACATHPGKAIALNDVYAIRRVRISQSADNLFNFAVQVSGYYNVFRGNSAKRIKKNTSN